MGSFAMLSDITQSKKVESALIESERKIQNYYRNIALWHRHSSGMVSFSMSTPFGSQLLGYENPDDLIGKNAVELVDPALRETVLSRMIEVHTGTIPTILERFVRADGNFINVEVRTTPLYFSRQAGSDGSFL